MLNFSSLGISKAIVDPLKRYGIVKPSPIQEQSIPVIMEGKDIIAQAQTGTGKTYAFILPILEKLDRHAEHVQALIVTPTRELALQITDEIDKLAAHLDYVQALAMYGGQDVEKQLKKLKANPQIVVGTPGRILDHIRRETVNLSEVSYLVLDEADQMLHIGFLKEVEDIIKETPKNRQTMLFSATIPSEVRELAKRHMRSPEYIQIEKTQGPADNVKQVAIHTIDRAKQATLIHLIEIHRPYLAVIFCRTKRRVSKLYEVLKGHGFPCDELHGDLSQAKREQVMKRFRDAEIQLLIATDVAARGLDVEGVTHVFNYDIPQDAEGYIHRIGRTGRAGMKGLAITLYSTADRPTLELIEKALNIRIQKQNIGNALKEQNVKEETKKEPTSDQRERSEQKYSNGQSKKGGKEQPGRKKKGDAFKTRSTSARKGTQKKNERNTRQNSEGSNRNNHKVPAFKSNSSSKNRSGRKK
ncbi:DEAD/DEAH box helicase [Neobacillus mesonae]|uniref:DEAD/DEAH box helicase n=1 Tax=Neobacillus mesonae TaxID=1193713 RepID=UPI00203EAA5E|nr:DEAD/DEAH box helicase [Neobacillus mesonae]MCM3568290.1 DEAD/DEAH box helicase [Neobacillus mesonae]